ncbi:MAG: glycosyltransferase family 4 protein [Chlorobium sp.]
MRVLVVSQYFWPESFIINDIVTTLKKKGMTVEVLTGKPNYPQGKTFIGYHACGFEKEFYKGVLINRIPLFPRGKGRICLALNYLSFVVSGLLFAPFLLRNKKYDIIFIYSLSPILQAIPALYLGWLKRCPVVLWLQDLWPESLVATGYFKSRVIIGAIRYVVRFIYRNADLILVQSRAFEESVRNLASATPVVYYPNSFDNVFVNPAIEDLPVIEGLGEGFSVMFAGNIGSAQAVSVIVDAASLLKEYAEIHFFILGDGSARQWMLEEAGKRELINLHLTGSYPFEMMPRLLEQASVLLVTLADKPIFALTVPSKMQAYMAAGRPIIACLNGEGARMVVEAGAGMVTAAEDPWALADTILCLYRLTPSERKKMGENGRRYSQNNFDHERLVDQLIGYLHSVSNGSQNISK